MSEPTSAAIDIRNLVKVYQGGKRALDDVTLQVPRGTIFGLLGPNGAGKSTLINILAGLVNKTSGTASIWGFDIDAQARNAKNSIGIVNQEILFDPFFTPRETLENQAGFYGVPSSERRTDEILDALGLGDKKHAKIRQLSGGMKRRLMVAKALVHTPPILILDEPTAGVDVGGRAAIVDLMAEISASEIIAAILVTHNLQAIARCAERVLYLEHTVRAWGLWNELSAERDLSAIQIVAGDHKAMAMDGD